MIRPQEIVREVSRSLLLSISVCVLCVRAPAFSIHLHILQTVFSEYLLMHIIYSSDVFNPQISAADEDNS